MVMNKYGLSEDDYVDLGYIALCEAALYYKPEKGKFSTIATTFIKNKFFKEFRYTRTHPDYLSSEYKEEYDFLFDNFVEEYGYENVENKIISKDICSYLENTLTGKTLLVYQGLKDNLNLNQISKKYNIPYQTAKWHRQKIRNIIEKYWKED